VNQAALFRLIIPALIMMLLLPRIVQAHSYYPGNNTIYGVVTGTEFFSYHSFSQVRNKFPMIAGYPVFTTLTPGITAGIYKTKGKRSQVLTLSSLLPSQISSDNGSGENYILNMENTLYSRTSLGYNLWMPLLHRAKAGIEYGISTGLLHEFRKLSYKSGIVETANDISLYAGPGLKAYCKIVPRWITETDVNTLFHAPWLNYGVKNKVYPENTGNFRSPYHTFIYETLFSLKTGYQVSPKYLISLAYQKQDLIGYGSEHPSFKSRSLIHYKLDRIHRFRLIINIAL